jgi:hypothetical protein
VAFKTLASSLPCFQQLHGLSLGRTKGQNFLFRDEDVLDIGRSPKAFEAWPAPYLVDLKDLVDHVIVLNQCWRTLDLPPAAENWIIARR